MIAGLFSGLGAALFQSLSYLGTRHFAHNRGTGSSRQLMVFGHLWMGVFGAIVLACEWPEGWRWLGDVWVPVLQMTLFYLVGQVGMILALRHAEPSRVSPLMGVKIVFLAGLSSFLAQPQVAATAPVVGLTWMQWAGVILAVVAAVALNYAGVAFKKQAVAAVMLACLAFTVSDWNIARGNVAIRAALPGASILQISFLNVGLAYVLAAVPAMALAPIWGTRKVKDWMDAAPFAVTWFAGMLFLFWCFAEVGPLLGAILQSTRGLMSIIIGSLLIHWGHVHMEPHSSRGVLARRLAAGALMFGAVGLYVIKVPGNLRMEWWHF